MKTLFLFVLFFSTTLFAQITITSTDVSNYFAVGNSVARHYTDWFSSSYTFDIGSAGGGNNWNFAGIGSQTPDIFSLLSVDVITTPYASLFPGATFATYIDLDPYGSWSYFSLGSNMGNMGQASTSGAFQGVFTVINNPASIEMQLPMTYNTTWFQSYVTTSSYPGNPTAQTNYSINVVVDAWGTMTLPGGGSFEALRIRKSTSAIGYTDVQYSFLAKNGANVSVWTSDPNPPTSGVIDVDGYSWNTPFTSDVEQISGPPQDFNLAQNYPNPFNPSTKIEYSIPQSSFVQLKVYDILGNEVATLVNEEQAVGSYRADFSGAGLSSGMYIAKLQAGNYTKTIKMTLMK
jgi:hypothetical protein